MKEPDAPSAKPGDILTIGDDYGRVPPLTPLEVKRLEKIIKKSLDDKAQAWLLDALRGLIVGIAKSSSELPSWKDYQKHLQRISDASSQLIRALTDYDQKAIAEMRFEFQNVLSAPSEFEQFLTSLKLIGGHARWAVEKLEPGVSKRGPKVKFIDGAFLRTIVNIARSVDADVSLPSHRNADDDERPIVAFAQHALWLATDRARAMTGMSAAVIDSLEKLHDRSSRALVEALEKAVK